jgi:hypothetical protein
MLFVEKGGESQIGDELLAYNPMIPQGNEIIFTFMIQYTDTAKRHAYLTSLGRLHSPFVSLS